MERFFDILFSGLAIILFAPLLIMISIILKFTGEGEIFYIQHRVGKDGKIFRLLKFATMLKNSENMGAGTVTVKNDNRVLPVGKFLRKTKLNEMPQLLNVFYGNMSIIGPRPLHEKQFSFYKIEDQKIISSVTPGLSGIGSIIFRDEEEILKASNDPDQTYKDKITPRKAKLEKWFVKNKSIFLYFKLIFLTIIAVANSKLNMQTFFKDLNINNE